MTPLLQTENHPITESLSNDKTDPAGQFCEVSFEVSFAGRKTDLLARQKTDLPGQFCGPQNWSVLRAVMQKLKAVELLTE